MKLLTQQERVFLSGPETCRVSLRLVDAEGNALPLSITRAVFKEVSEPGRTAQTAAFGPMVQVVENSTQHMTAEDLKAIAVYLQSVGAPAAVWNALVDALRPLGLIPSALPVVLDARRRTAS